MALDLPSWAVVAFNYVGLPWPGIDEDELRAWAKSVRAFANQVTDNSARTHRAVAQLADSSPSASMNALAARSEHHNQLVADLHGPMNDFADALDAAADVVVAQKWAVITAACALAGEFVGTQIGAIFTLGADETAVPAEIEATKWLVKLALEELEAALIGKLAGIAATAISDHVNRFVGNLFDDALPVAMEVQSLKISYQGMRDAAQTIRGHATETEQVGDTAYDENANRDLDDPGEGTGGRWPVVQAIKQVLIDVALDLFKTLTSALSRTMEDTAGVLMSMVQKFEEDDQTMAGDVPEPTISGPPAEPQAGSPGAPEGGLPAGGGSGEPDLVKAGDDPGAPDAVAARPGGLDPVDIATGDVILAAADVTLPGVLPLVLERTHRSSWRTGRWLGRSWLSSFDQRLLITGGRVTGAFADGRVLTWTYPNGTREAPTLPVTGPAWPLRRNPDGIYQVTDPQRGLTWRFEHRAGYDAGPGDEGELPLISLTDRVGHEIVFNYDATGQPSSVAHSGGYRVQVTMTDGHIAGLTLAGRDGYEDVPLVSYEYDTDGNLSGVLNSSGLPLKFSYDTAGRLTGWLDRNGHYYLYAYDSQGRCVQGEGTGGAMSGTYTYEPGKTRWTDAAGAITTCELTNSGQVAAITDALGNLTRWEYDSRGNVTTRVDPLGRVTRHAYDDRGNLIVITRPDGSQVTAEYDDQCQAVLLIGPGGAEWRQEYDPQGNRTRVVAPDGTATKFGYDNRGHLARVTDSDGAVTGVACDRAGLPLEVTRPDEARAQYDRDLLGRVTRIKGPDGGTTHLVWTTEGQLVSRTFPDGSTESWAWDAEGNLGAHISAAGSATRYQYGPFDKVVTMLWPDGTRSDSRYNRQLRLTEVTHAGLTWRYEYDLAGGLVAETDYNGATTTYSYDAAGQLTRRTNAVGQEIQFAYDALGNLIEQSADGAVTTFGYDRAGRVVHTRNAHAEVVLERDARGRVTKETCNGRAMTTEYDVVGRVARRVTPSGAERSWEFDQAGRPVGMTADGHQLRFAYDVAGQEIRRDLPGGLTLTQEWDRQGRLTVQALAGPGQTGLPEGPAFTGQLLQRRAYSYRADGFPDRIEDLLAGSRTLSLDAVGRVTAVNGPNWTERYTYDPAGNLTSATWPAPPSDSISTLPDVGAQGQRHVTGTLITQAGNIRYRHDRAGRVTTRQRTRISRKPDTWHYQWDAENRLTSATTPDGTIWRYRYDPFGRRIAKQRLTPDGNIADQTTFAWEGPVLIEQFEIDGHRERITTWDYEPGTFTPLTQAERTSSLNAPQQEIDQRFYAIITDLTGTPSELVASDGTLAGHQQQTIWGGMLWSGNVRTALRFPGQYADPETGLHYNYHRYYDPVSASYLTSDPFGLVSGPNPHSYVSNPQVITDPLGLMECSEAQADALKTYANAVHGRLDRIARKMRTTAVVRAITDEGDVVDVYAGSRPLNRAQRDMVKQLGGIVADNTDDDAEVSALRYIAAHEGWTPVAGAASRPVCPLCQNILMDTGAAMTGRARIYWDKYFNHVLVAESRFVWKGRWIPTGLQTKQ